MTTINELLKTALSKNVCYKRAVACVVETLDKKYVLGWNGAPPGVDHLECARSEYPSGEGMHLCEGIHAEQRAISNAAKDGIAIKGGTLYLDSWFPCDTCAKSIIASGIDKIVTPDEVYKNRSKSQLVNSLVDQSYNFEKSERQLREAGVKIAIDPSIRPI